MLAYRLRFPNDAHNDRLPATSTICFGLPLPRIIIACPSLGKQPSEVAVRPKDIVLNAIASVVRTCNTTTARRHPRDWVDGAIFVTAVWL